MSKKTDKMTAATLRFEARCAWLDGRVKRSRELQTLAAKREREEAKRALATVD